MTRASTLEVFIIMDVVDEQWWNRGRTAQERVLPKAVTFHFF